MNKNKYLTGVQEPVVDLSFNHQVAKPGDLEILLKASDLTDRDKHAMADWSNITTFHFGIYDGNTKSNFDFTDPANRHVIQKLEWVTP